MTTSIYNGREVVYIEFDVSNGHYVLLDANGDVIDDLKLGEYLSQPQLWKIGNSNGNKSTYGVAGAAGGGHRGAGSPFHSGAVGQPGGAVPLGAVTVVFAGGADPALHRTIPDAGIRAGEVVGKRCWWLVEGKRLFSVYMTSVEWFPNTPMTGDVTEGFGVHAFKEHEELNGYGRNVLLFGSLNGFRPNCHLVSGTVAMWGEVVEHRRGYRAEYAKILSLDEGASRGLRMKYGV